MLTLIKVRGIRSKKYNTNKYTKLLIYIPSNNSTTFIKSVIVIAISGKYNRPR